MDNSEKLSLFRKGTSNSVGLSDIPLPQIHNILPKLSLNKETIANLNNDNHSQVIMMASGGTPCIPYKDTNRPPCVVRTIHEGYDCTGIASGCPPACAQPKY